VHVELDADKQAPPDLQDRYLLHGEVTSSRLDLSAAHDLSRAL
jgi:hypothetical protein